MGTKSQRQHTKVAVGKHHMKRIRGPRMRRLSSVGRRLPSMKITMKLKQLVVTKTRVETGRASWILRSQFNTLSFEATRGVHPKSQKVKPKRRTEKRATQTTSAPRNLLLQ